MSAPQDKASGKLWEGAREAQHTLGNLDGRRPALIDLHDATENGNPRTAPRHAASVSPETFPETR